MEKQFTDAGQLPPVPVEIRLYGQLRDAVGRKSIDRAVDDRSTVEDVLESIAADYPELSERLFDEEGTIDARVVIRKNRTTVADPGVPVADGDRLALATQIVGGGDPTGR